MYLYNSWYLIYLNNKIHKVQITEFISNVFIVSDGQDRIDENKFCLSIDILSPPKKQYIKFSFEILSPNIMVTFSNINFNC